MTRCRVVHQQKNPNLRRSLPWLAPRRASGELCWYWETLPSACVLQWLCSPTGDIILGTVSTCSASRLDVRGPNTVFCSTAALGCSRRRFSQRASSVSNALSTKRSCPLRWSSEAMYTNLGEDIWLELGVWFNLLGICLLYTSPSPRD